MNNRTSRRTPRISLRKFAHDAIYSWREGRRVFVYWLAPCSCIGLFIIQVLTGPPARVGTRTAALFEFTVLNSAPFALLAIGAGIVLATGGVDLSVAGTATLTGILYALLAHIPVTHWIAVSTAVLFAGALGLLLGWAVATGLPPLITSWAMGTLWATAALVIATVAPDHGLLSASVTGISLPIGYAPRLSTAQCIMLIVIASVGLNIFNLPRRAKAVGANRDSAEYAGVRTKVVLRWTYVVNGLLAGTAGLLFALLNSTASTTDLQGRELIAIAIAVIGGTVMTGGYLNLWSIAFAAALWKLLEFTVFGTEVPFLPDFQQRIISVLFALVIIVLAYISARLERGLFVPGLMEPKHSQRPA